MDAAKKLGHDDKNPYFFSSGMFSENFINNVLDETENSFLREHWDSWQEGSFEKIYLQLKELWNEKRELLPGYKESQLEEEFIKPVLKLLGWDYLVQPSVDRYGKLLIPDYALFSSPKAKANASEIKDLKLFGYATALAEAKAWDIDLDGSKAKTASPSFQTTNYMVTTGVRWGILTNGLYWRLYCLDSKESHHSFYEINLEAILSTKARDKFRYFYSFFRKDAFVESPNLKASFVDLVFRDGEAYAGEIEERLKKRAFEIVEKIGQGFLHEKKVISDDELHTAYDMSLKLLFRMMFILNCEAKGVLDTSQSQAYFAYSLRSLCIKVRDENPKDWGSQAFNYGHLVRLLKLIAKGDERLGISRLGEELFSVECVKFFSANEIPDFIFNDILIQLAFKTEGKKQRFIDYSTLSVDHLGSIYEGLLEFNLILDSGKPKISATSKQRERSGSYYTQEPVVRLMAEKAISALLTKTTKAAQLLDLKIIDPAMGSGHFLMGALRYIEAQIQVKLLAGDSSLDVDTDKLSWMVLHKCIYGVDMNPTAVELAKYSMWIATAKKGMPLEPLDDQLVCFNSLTDKAGWKKNFSKIEFDCVLANPPYVAQKNSEEVEESGESEGQSDLYLEFFKSTLNGNIPLRAGGSFGYIIPDPFLVRGNAKQTREMLLDKNTLLSCIHATGLFPGIGVSNVILTGLRSSAKDDAEITFIRLDKSKQREEFFSTYKLPADCEEKTHKAHVFKTSEGFELTYLLTPADRKRFAQMVKSGATVFPKFKDRRGEEISKAKVNGAKSPNGIPIAIGGESIGQFEFRADAIVKVKADLVRKNLANYSPNKIMLQKSAPRFISAVDDGTLHKDGIVCTQAIYTLKKDDQTYWMDEYTLCSILNSDLANDWLFKRVTGYKLLQPHYEQQDLKTFPLPNLQNGNLNTLQFQKDRKSHLDSLKAGKKFQIDKDTAEEKVWAAISASAEFLQNMKFKARRDEAKEKELQAFLNDLVEFVYGFKKEVKLAA